MHGASGGDATTLAGVLHAWPWPPRLSRHRRPPPFLSLSLLSPARPSASGRAAMTLATAPPCLLLIADPTISSGRCRAPAFAAFAAFEGCSVNRPQTYWLGHAARGLDAATATLGQGRSLGHLSPSGNCDKDKTHRVRSGGNARISTLCLVLTWKHRNTQCRCFLRLWSEVNI